MSTFLSDPNFLLMEPVSEHEDHLEVGNKTKIRKWFQRMEQQLFIDLMKQFYELGWMRGTGGAMGVARTNKLFISPSALQKERLKESDIFIYDLMTHTEIGRPKNPTITVSSCAPLFSHVMIATGSKCVLHSHSINSNLITQIIKEDTFSISHQEYIKGIFDPFTGKNMKYDDTLVIPIIDNMPSESLLLPGLTSAMLEYPRSTAVLVRNHGLFVWGNTWQEAKIQMECVDYLLELGAKMLEKGLSLVKEEGLADVKNSQSTYQLSFAPDES